jgi:hypothetical protein
MKKQTAKTQQRKANNKPDMANPRRRWQSAFWLRPHGFLLFVFCCLFFAWGSFCSLARDSGAVRVRIHSMQADLAPTGRGEIAVILMDESRERFLPISVGGDQALSIQLGRQGLPAKRPLAHDLIANILKTLEVRVERVIITDLKEGVYYAEIILRQGGRTHQVDARPSDAIALSLRVDAPIFAMPHLLQKISDLSVKEEVTGQAEVTSWGMTVQSLTETLANFFGRKDGVLVSDVMENSLAAQSGIQPGDILVQLDKKELRDVEEFLKSLAATKGAKSVEIGVLRGGQILTFTMKNAE